VVIRVVAYTQPPTTTVINPGTYLYHKQVAGPYQWASTSSVTYPFRVRGVQVRVIETDESGQKRGVANAYVLRQDSIKQAQFATYMTDPNNNENWRTNGQGYLEGRGTLNAGDKIIALLPISLTGHIPIADKIAPGKLELYHTSAPITTQGLAMKEVAPPGLQELTISPENKLLLFNFNISLEWDARNDSDYLKQLEQDLLTTSEVLYDLTNGQAALGSVRIYQAKENWVESDIQIYARSDIVPNANLGGIVSATVTYTTPSRVYSNAFIPGHIRIGATWNRYGNPGGTIGEDWPRTLAHEIGHYAFFLLDDYLGISDQKLIKVANCFGTAMTDPYSPESSEFLSRIENANGFSWDKQAECQNTVAQKFTERADWEAIQNLYSLENNVEKSGTGPNLPLAITHVEWMGVTAPNNTLTAPFVYPIDPQQSGTTLALRAGTAHAYLVKTRNTETKLEDDELVPLGSPNGQLVRARGAAPGDRFCLFDNGSEVTRLGCITINTESASLPLSPAPDWRPQIRVTPVNSTTLIISVTQQIQSGDLYAQIYPGDRPTETVDAPVRKLVPVATDTYSQTFSFSHTVMSGYVRIWIPGTADIREAITPFYIPFGWDGFKFSAWDGFKFSAWDTRVFQTVSENLNSWSAPLASPDGQVRIFNLQNILDGNVASIIQPLEIPPRLDSWLTPVGNVYLYRAAQTPSLDLVVQFQYLQRAVPRIDEGTLKIYYSPDNGVTWQRIEDTEIDSVRNLATAKMKGEGLYGLLATIATPPLNRGWEEFAYADTDPRPVPNALASVKKAYTSVYWRDGARWLLYDRTVRPEFFGLVNYVETSMKPLEMKPLESYWIFVLNDDTIPYIGVPSGQEPRTDNVTQLPPATFYGWVEPTDTYTPRVGDPIIARIDDVICGVGEVLAYDPLRHADFSSDREYSIVTFSQRLFLPFVSNIHIEPSRYVYKIQIRSDTGDRCGVFGREISFEIGGKSVPSNHPWGNSQACYHPLGKPTPKPYQCFTFATPDLIVDQLNVTENSVQVLIKNVGTAAVPPGIGFWVDVYINPGRRPEKVNDTWQVIAVENNIPLDKAQGLVWNVKELALPFEPGQTITFTIGDQNYRPDYSNFFGTILPGDRLYAHVDSANQKTDYGNVLETHEMLLHPYNNIRSYPVELYLPLVAKLE